MKQLRLSFERLWASERNRELLILLALALLALIPRLYSLGSVPPGLDGDEQFNAVDALRLGWGNWPVYFPGNKGREALFIYLMAGSLRLFGRSVWAIRLPAALLGAGSVLVTYATGRQLFSRRVGLIGAAMMAVSLWPIMTAHWGLRAVSLTFCTALTVFLYSRAVDQPGKGLSTWALAGLALGLTMYTYIPARVFPLVIAVWLAWLALVRRGWLRSQWRGALLSFLVALVVFAPFGLYMVQNPEQINQRVSEFGSALEQLSDGQWQPLLDTVFSTAQIFTFKGDPAERYNVRSRPIFDPLSGLLFAIGLAACLWLAFSRRVGPKRRVAYGLMLVWLAVMFTPAALIGPHTAALRSAGAMVPAYLILAIGVDAIYRQVSRRWPSRGPFWRRGFTAFVAMGVLATLAISWRAYFAVWPDDPMVREVYHADLAQIGAYLNAHRPLAGSDVFVAYDYVTDATPQSFTYYSDQDVLWFDHRSALPWRAAEPGAEDWYIVAASKPLDPALEARLATAGSGQLINYENGDPAFTLYRVHPSSIAQQPEQPVPIAFDGGPELVGFDLPDDLYRGDGVQLTTYWQIPAGQQPAANQLTYVQASLEDASGNAWARAESLLGYPQAGWLAADGFIQQLELQIPQGMPPGPAYLRFGMRDWQGRPYQVIAGDGQADRRGGPFLIRSRPSDAIDLPPDRPVFEGTVALAGQAFSTLIVPGLPLNLVLDWLALRQPSVDYRLQLQLSQEGAAKPFLSQTYELWPGVYPPSQWQAGERVTTFHQLDVPLDVPTEGTPVLTMSLLPPDEETPLTLTQGSDVLAEMEWDLRPHNFERPPIKSPLEAQFGESIKLLGYELDTREGRPGGELQLTLFWQALDTPDDNYTVFNHVIGEDGQLHGQLDSPPVGDAWLTSTWLPGEIVVDRRSIPIWPDAPAGSHILIVGMYTADGEEIERLPVYQDGRPLPGDQLELTTVTIRP